MTILAVTPNILVLPAITHPGPIHIVEVSAGAIHVLCQNIKPISTINSGDFTKCVADATIALVIQLSWLDEHFQFIWSPRADGQLILADFDFPVHPIAFITI